MSHLIPVLTLNESKWSGETNNICLLCERQILKSDDSSVFKEKCWNNLKQHADTWKDINIPSNDKN